MTPIRAAFPLGSRVRLSDSDPARRHRYLHARLGVVAGYSRDGEFAWVVWDGTAPGSRVAVAREHLVRVTVVPGGHRVEPLTPRTPTVPPAGQE